VRSHVPFGIARKLLRLSTRPLRAGYCTAIAGMLVIVGCESLQTATADGDTRTISFKHTHIDESLTITYKVNGRYDEAALEKINFILRDWREKQPVKMDPHLIDLLWEVYREVEGKAPINIVCGYRSPDTNAMLRKRSSGVAKFSQHMLGKATDFRIPGVPIERIREAGLRAQRGGVGYYPGSDFIHLDTGNVRHWPRMPEAQLAKVIAKGPLTAYKKGGDVQVASVSPKVSNPFTKLFGGKDADEDAAPAPAAKPAAVAAKTEQQKLDQQKLERLAAAAVPMPAARPTAKVEAKVAAKVEPKSEPKLEAETQPAGFGLASATSRPVQLRPAQQASLVGPTPQQAASANDVISARGFWQGLPDTEAQAKAASVAAKDPKEPAKRTEPVATASVSPWTMPSREQADPSTLGYAPVNVKAPQTRPAPMGNATRPTDGGPVTVATKRSVSRPTVVSTPAVEAGPVKAGQRFNNPWMRAMIVAPSAGGFMSTSLLGAPDYRVLGPYLQKPTTSVMMTFSDDPYLGMSTAKFSGSAVVFVSTVTFFQRTAALQ
jgi:uncharacterized protein YcbK (DUF882 family)